MVHERLHKRGAVVDCNILTVLLLEVGDFLHGTVFD
jgi:hypothetical protein